MPVDPDLRPSVGGWRLLSAVMTFTDTGEQVETFAYRKASTRFRKAEWYLSIMSSCVNI